MSKEAPEVTAWKIPTNGPAQIIELDCPHCDNTHWHGEGLGHRVSHCKDAGQAYTIIKILEKRDG